MKMSVEREDFPLPWNCSGCLREFGDTDRSPRLEIDDPETNSTLLFCDLCVEDRNFPQPAEGIVVVDDDEQPAVQPVESLWRAGWDRNWLAATAVWVAVCMTAGIISGILR